MGGWGVEVGDGKLEVGGKMVLRCCDGKVLQSSSTRVQRWRLEGRGEGIEV
jgi:hypothetical protein